MVLSTTRPNGLSSTPSTRSGGIATAVNASSAPSTCIALAMTRATVSVKVVPPPRRDATLMSPPMPRAICLTEERPSPAPPKREAIETLACENGRNRRLISFRLMPMPLSEIAKATPTLPFFARAGTAPSATCPVSVNFTALSIRFSSAARSRIGSPTTSPGNRSEIATSACNPLAAARPASESPALRARARRSNRSSRIALPPWRSLAASTNKVARLARCSAPALMVSTQRRSRSASSDVASRSLIARIPVSGVRTSCANTASACSIMADFPAALRAGLAAARVFGGRRFGTRFLRGSRDFDAIHKPLPAAACHGDHRESRRGFGVHRGISRMIRKSVQRFSDKIMRQQKLKLEEAADTGGRHPRRAKLTQAGRPGRFGELVASLVADQAMMAIGRLGQPKQLLQQAVHAGGVEQILAADQFGDALQGVVDHDGEMIAGRRFLAREDDVAPGLRIGGDDT